jgi:hypothetical protein
MVFLLISFGHLGKEWQRHLKTLWMNLEHAQENMRRWENWRILHLSNSLGQQVAWASTPRRWSQGGQLRVISSWSEPQHIWSWSWKPGKKWYRINFKFCLRTILYVDYIWITYGLHKAWFHIAMICWPFCTARWFCSCNSTTWNERPQRAADGSHWADRLVSVRN